MAVTPQTIWNALLKAGATPVQAAAIMGNMRFESGLDPESGGIDSNGKWAGGLVSWNTGHYPNARGLVTGNPVADLATQIAYLIKTGALQRAQGSTPAAAASDFAARYEACKYCYPGGSQNVERQQAATAIYAAGTSGDWGNIPYSSAPPSTVVIGNNPTGTPLTVDPNSLSNPAGFDVGCQRASGSNCIISPPGTSWCFTYCEAKALLGGAAMVAGAALALAGLLVVARGAVRQAAASVAAKAGPAGAAAATVAQRTEGGLGTARTVPVGAGRSVPGPAARRPARPATRAQNRQVQSEGSEAYDAGYQRAMADLDARARELEVPF